MNRNVIARVLLPSLFAFASLETIACSAPVASTESVTAEPTTATPANDPTALGGGAHVANAPVVDAAGGEGALAASSTVATMSVFRSDGTKVDYDVVAYALGVSKDVVIGSATTGAGGGKAKLEDVAVTIHPKAGVAPLLNSLFTGEAFDKITFSRPGAKAGSVETFATLGEVFVTANGSGTAGDRFTLVPGVLTVAEGKASVTVDAIHNTASCDGSCPCDAVTLGLGSFEQAPADFKVPANMIRIDSVEVDVSNAVAPSSAPAGAGAGKARLDALSIAGPSGATGMCAMYAVALGAHAKDLHIGVASLSTSTSKNAPPETTVWDACLAAPKAVTWSGSTGTSPVQTIDFAAGGVIRTDFPVDPVTGAPKQKTSSGWSFVQNAAIATCDEVVTK
jgi:hypothetical protein